MRLRDGQPLFRLSFAAGRPVARLPKVCLLRWLALPWWAASFLSPCNLHCIPSRRAGMRWLSKALQTEEPRALPCNSVCISTEKRETDSKIKRKSGDSKDKGMPQGRAEARRSQARRRRKGDKCASVTPSVCPSSPPQTAGAVRQPRTAREGRLAVHAASANAA